MKRYFTSFILVLVFAGVSHAGISYSWVEDGSRWRSGGRDEWKSYGQTDLLLTFNNHFFSRAITAPTYGMADGAVGNDPQDGTIPLGVLMDGPGYTKLIYDRLAVLPVLQLLGYDDYQSYTTPYRIPQYAGDVRPVIHSPGAVQDSYYDPAPQPEFEPQTTVIYITRDLDLTPIPEPASLMLLGLGVVFMLPRRNKSAQTRTV